MAHYEIDFLTEEFVKGNDLSLQTLTFTPDGSGNFYTLCRDEAEQFPTDPDGGTLLPLLDDSYEKVELAQGMQVSLYATSYSSFYVGSDGDIAFESGKNEMDRSLSFHFKGHRISGLLDDLNPEKTKGVTWKQTEDRVAVTYLNIPEYDKPTLLNSFQMELFFDGVIRITYLNISATAGIAGLSRGGGMLAHFSESNLSDYAPCIPLPGDADHNGIIELGDTIRILKMLAGEAEHLHPDADVDGDGKIGITEVIFLLRAIGEGR